MVTKHNKPVMRVLILMCVLLFVGGQQTQGQTIITEIILNIPSAAGLERINTINGPVCDASIQVPSEVATIQAAIDAVCDGGEVVVAPNTYNESINFLGKAITLRSASGDPADTIIDATGVPNLGTGVPVVRCVSGETDTTVLDGFTITGGTGDTTVFGSAVGGGMFNSGSSPTVTNCILWGNVDDADGDFGGPFMDESAQIHTDSGTPVVNYSIVQGGWSGAGGVGIVNADPLFDAPAAGDLHLLPGSPAIDAGNFRAYDSAGGGGVDLDGNPRLVDDLNPS